MSHGFENNFPGLWDTSTFDAIFNFSLILVHFCMYIFAELNRRLLFGVACSLLPVYMLWLQYNFDRSIVDSGTTDLRLPPTVFNYCVNMLRRKIKVRHSVTQFRQDLSYNV